MQFWLHNMWESESVNVWEYWEKQKTNDRNWIFCGLHTNCSRFIKIMETTVKKIHNNNKTRKTLNLRTRADMNRADCVVRTINEEMWMRLATTAEAAASGRRNKCPKWITIKNDTIKMKNGSARKRKRESESRLKRSIAERKGIKTKIMYAWKGAWDFAWARRTYAQTHTARTVFIESAFVVGVTVPVHMGWKVLSLSLSLTRSLIIRLHTKFITEYRTLAHMANSVTHVHVGLKQIQINEYKAGKKLKWKH